MFKVLFAHVAGPFLQCAVTCCSPYRFTQQDEFPDAWIGLRVATVEGDLQLVDGTVIESGEASVAFTPTWFNQFTHGECLFMQSYYSTSHRVSSADCSQRKMAVCSFTNVGTCCLSAHVPCTYICTRRWQLYELSTDHAEDCTIFVIYCALNCMRFN